MSLASQMYDYYVKPYLGEKGQDLVEYALLLAGVLWKDGQSQIGRFSKELDE